MSANVVRRAHDPRRSAGVVRLLVVASILAIGVARPARGTSGGDPYVVPVVVDTHPDPTIVETTITADETTVDLGNGLLAHAMTFNGTIPGPEFRLRVGDTVIVHFANELDEEPCGIHWHGIELANASDGTPLTQNQVEPGGTFLYKFRVTRPGIYWYHPHHHSSTNQLFKGLYGSIVVTDDDEDQLIADGVLPPASQTRTLALSDTTVCKAPVDGATCGNDDDTYDDSLPHVSGTLDEQAGPTPCALCEDAPIDHHGDPLPAGVTWLAGDIPNIQPSGTGGRVNEGQTVLTNGRNVGGRAGDPDAPGALAGGAYTMDVAPGTGLRLRLGNTSTVRFFRLRLTESDGTQIKLVRIGGQGGLLDEAVFDGGTSAGGYDWKYEEGEILLDPGSRADVVAVFPADATGVATLWTLDFERTGQGFADVPTVPVAHFNVTGSAGSYALDAGDALLTAVGSSVEVLGAPTAILLDPVADFDPDKDGLASQNIQLTNTGNSLGIDDHIGEHDFTGVDYTEVMHFESARYAELGETYELTVTNRTAAHHPFHLHGFSIQPIRLDPDPAPKPGVTAITGFVEYPPEFYDNIDVPAGSVLTLRLRTDDRPLMDGTTPGGGYGRWVFHCHIFFHASFGMISEFVVLEGDGNERPYVNADATLVEVDEGDLATMTGTHADMDGDAITLAASIGTVVDNGDGTWDWSYATTDGPEESGCVFITATDANGVEDQATFELVVNNLPPTIDITSPPSGSVYLVGSSVEVTAAVDDAGTADVLECDFDWDGGGPDTSDTPVGGVCGASNTFSAAGVYTVEVTVSDDDGASATDTVVIVVYDPNAGHLTGAGDIDSPAGAYVADPLIADKAHFDAQAKYKKDETVPRGKLKFDLKSKDVDFKVESTGLDWLVIVGSRAQVQGTATVNGGGSYGFLLTVRDGKAKDKKDPPGMLRLEVWDKLAADAVVYDNAPGADDIDVSPLQELRSGHVEVHKGK